MKSDNDRRKATVFIAFGLFILWGFGWNTVGRQLLTSIDGVIVVRRVVPSATEYTVRGDDGNEKVFRAGATDASLPGSMPVGTRIRKKLWHLDYERDGHRESFPWILYSSVLGIAVSLIAWGILILRSQPPKPLHENNRTGLSGSLRNLQYVRQLLSILLEGAGVILFGSGILTTLLFLSTKSRVELTGRGSELPDECEAAFWNHGGYACWYTIQDHPFWFALSLGALATGAGIIARSQRHWVAKREN